MNIFYFSCIYIFICITYKYMYINKNKLETLPLELTNIIYEYANNEKNNFYYCMKELKELRYAHFIYDSIFNHSLNFMKYAIFKLQSKLYKNNYKKILRAYIVLVP